MITRTHRNFDKRYARLPTKIQDQFKKRRNLFISQPFHPLLNNHSVDEVFPGWRSINVTGDYRALYEEREGEVVFMTIGTHSELYS